MCIVEAVIKEKDRVIEKEAIAVQDKRDEVFLGVRDMKNEFDAVLKREAYFINELKQAKQNEEYAYCTLKSVKAERDEMDAENKALNDRVIALLEIMNYKLNNGLQDNRHK